MEQPQQEAQHWRSTLRKFSGDGGILDTDSFIREVKLLLHLQPLRDDTAAAWILEALEGGARWEICQQASTTIDTPRKILQLIHNIYGDHRDATTLAAAFYQRRQNPTETVTEFATNLHTLWDKVNAL